jgi:DNA-binding MarR family transcriptional regulator
LRLRNHNLHAILACVQVSTSPSPHNATAAQTATGPDPAQTATGPDPLAAALYALIVFLNKHCNSDLFEAVGALELTLTQIKLLHHLEAADGPLTLKDAAELVLISLPAASRTVDDLVRRGFVERYEDTTDRRMKRLAPTEEGRAVTRRLNAARLSGVAKFTETLTDAERTKLAAALSELLEREPVAACRPEGPLS